MPRPHVRQAKLSEGEREGERGEEDRSVAPVRTPFALYTLLLYDLCRCRRRRVVIPLLNRRRQTVRGVKYEPKCRCSLLLLCPDSLAAPVPRGGESVVKRVNDRLLTH